MKRSPILLTALLCGATVLPPLSSPIRAATSPAANPDAAVPATRYFPLAVGNKWEVSFKRNSSLNMIPASGDSRAINTTTEGIQTLEIVRKDDERSGENGPVFVQKTSEVAKASTPGEEGSTRLVGESYFRVNNRGVWLISDGEPNDANDAIEKITDRSLPLLWIPSGVKPDRSWIINCQIDTTITAKITAHVGKAQRLKINGETYDNCLPVVSVAENLKGRLDLGIGQAPIREGRLIDVTWYAPGVGVVKSHQLANFTLEPPNPGFDRVEAHFEESQEIQPGYKVQP